MIGMHRSGTSLVMRLLDRLGMYAGSLKDRNHESVYFQLINDWMLRQAGASWDQPSAFDLLLEDAEVRGPVSDHAAALLRGPLAASYLGLAGRMRGSLFAMDRCWGWKDPRNTITLPVWLDVFPAAKVVHVRRHGVAVAMSLVNRRASALEAGRDRSPATLALGLAVDRVGRVIDSVRCGTLEGAFTLWEDYMMRARGHLDRIGPAAIDIGYEDLLADPERWLAQLGDFCNLRPSADMIRQAAGQINPGRADPLSGDIGALAFAETVGPRLAQYGY